MNRGKTSRRKLLFGSASGIAVALAGCVGTPSVDDNDQLVDDGDANEDDSDGDAADELDDDVHEVRVGPDGEFVFTPGTDSPLEIDPGDTVVWVWHSNAHNVNPQEVPAEAVWEGHVDLEDEGFEYEYTFDVEGHYHYICDPHVEQGMVADLVVGEGVDEVDDAEPDDDEGISGELPTDPGAEDFVDMTGEDVVEIETREGTGNEPSFIFDPPFVRVDQGTTIRWVNVDGVFHTVTSTPTLDRRTGGGDEFNATISSVGDTFEWRADDPGRQDYYCSPHAGFMFGSIEVE